jgi:AcrR family transcriptional regulator
LLDAAAALIDEKGIDGLTTSDVAARSGSSVGVVYRYFPNIQFLLRALAARNLERFVERAFPADTVVEAQWLENLDAPFDAYVELARTEPGFRALRFGAIIDERFVGRNDGSGVESANDELLSALVDVLRKRYGKIEPSEELLLDLEVAVEASTALLQRAFTSNTEGDCRFIDKARALARELLIAHGPEVNAA